ncbi:TerD family protein [Nostoc sp. CHAB 5824]|nr:TerD family protein [Nostoc sp. CHAB 5824]
MEDYFIETSMIMVELYFKDGKWRLNAVGSGYQGGLQAQVGSGINPRNSFTH